MTRIVDELNDGLYGLVIICYAVLVILCVDLKNAVYRLNFI